MSYQPTRISRDIEWDSSVSSRHGLAQRQEGVVSFRYLLMPHRRYLCLVSIDISLKIGCAVIYRISHLRPWAGMTETSCWTKRGWRFTAFESRCAVWTTASGRGGSTRISVLSRTTATKWNTNPDIRDPVRLVAPVWVCSWVLMSLIYRVKGWYISDVYFLS